ncbi:hypothetical protein J6590_033453 [Homalodisca vitripennis]|nr:hypothetical protein J6590_033453 [Homalodisca vitripennis]
MSNCPKLPATLPQNLVRLTRERLRHRSVKSGRIVLGRESLPLPATTAESAASLPFHPQKMDDSACDIVASYHKEHTDS